MGTRLEPVEFGAVEVVEAGAALFVVADVGIEALGDDVTATVAGVGVAVAVGAGVDVGEAVAVVRRGLVRVVCRCWFSCSLAPGKASSGPYLERDFFFSGESPPC